MEIICIKLTFAIKWQLFFIYKQLYLNYLLSVREHFIKNSHFIDVRIYFVWGET